MSHPRPRQDSILQRNEVPDGLLVGQALAGDQDAFECLANRYQRQLVGLIQGFLKDHDQSEDILQQVYLQLYLSLPILFRNVTLKGWLFQVARNCCLDELLDRTALRMASFFLHLMESKKTAGLCWALDSAPLNQRWALFGWKQGFAPRMIWARDRTSRPRFAN